MYIYIYIACRRRPGHYMLFHIVPAMRPRWLITVDEDVEKLSVVYYCTVLCRQYSTVQYSIVTYSNSNSTS